MEIKGFRLIIVKDKDGALMDVQCLFTASKGLHVALYAFHFKLADKKQETVQQVIQGAKRLANMKEKVVVVGKEPDDGLEQRVGAGPHDLAPGDERRAFIRVLDAEKGSYNVRVKIAQRKGKDPIVFEAPFVGDPGRLKGHVFEGEVMHLADSAKDVAEVELQVMDIPSSDP